MTDTVTQPVTAERDDALGKLRAAGWMVAVHNDYRLAGVAHTFWLFTHPSGRWIKGEGHTDEEALQEALSFTNELTHAPLDELEALRLENERLRAGRDRYGRDLFQMTSVAQSLRTDLFHAKNDERNRLLTAAYASINELESLRRLGWSDEQKEQHRVAQAAARFLEVNAATRPDDDEPLIADRTEEKAA